MSTAVGTPASRRGSRLPSLTGMRWWAALAVFVLHIVVFLPIYPFYGSEGYWHLAKAVPMQVGAAGVTFFFVLSGFVMWWTRRENDTELSFMWRRIKKIYPTHIVAALLLVLVIPIPMGRLDTWVPSLVLIQTWWPNWTSFGGLNVPAWSLASEMLFYLTFPFLAPLVGRIKDKFVPAAFAVLFAIIVAMHTAVYLWAPGDKTTENFFGARIPNPVPQVTAEYGYNASAEFFARDFVGYNDLGYWFSYYFPLMRLPEFFIGVLMCRLVLMGKWRTQRMFWPLVSLAVAFGLTWLVPINYKMSVLILLPTAAVIATAANRDAAGKRGLNATKRMVWFGDISYAFYLIQYPIMVIIVRFLAAGHRGGFWAWLGYAALALVASTIAAGLIYQYVDKPITSRKKRVGKHAQSNSNSPANLTVQDLQYLAKDETPTDVIPVR